MKIYFCEISLAECILVSDIYSISEFSKSVLGNSKCSVTVCIKQSGYRIFKSKPWKIHYNYFIVINCNIKNYKVGSFKILTVELYAIHCEKEKCSLI